MLRNHVLALILVSSLFATNSRASVTLNQFTVASSGPTSTSLFLTVGSAGSPGAGSELGAASAWPVTVNLPLLSSLPPSLIVNFPDRTSATLLRDKAEMRGEKSYLWTGRGNGCSAILSVYNSGFLGTISCLNSPYGIAKIPGGPGLQLTRYDQSLVQSLDQGPEPISASQLAALPAGAGLPNLLGTDTEVEILVLYTEGVRAGLDPAGGNANSVEYLEHFVDTTQQAMVNSTTPGQPLIAQTKFLHAQKVSRADGTNFADDLLYLQTDPEPVGLRNYWGADVVILVTQTGTAGLCGLSREPGTGGAPAPGPAFAPLAVAVLLKSCSVSVYPFTHEFGHIFGANHNPENNGNTTPLEPWAFGHWNTADGGNRTVMTYAISACPSCTLLLNYSNAQVYVDTIRTGLPNTRENARVIAETAPATAQYRASLGRIFADNFEP